MAKIRFEDLLLVYRNAAFATGSGDDEAVVTVTDPKIVALLTRVETEEYAVIETGVTLLDDLAKVQLGAAVKVRLETPRTGFGVLARTIDGLIKSLGGRRKEPRNYFLVDSRYEAGAPDPPELVQRYRKMLEIIDLLAHAATLVDETRSALIFVKDGQFEVPYLFDAADLRGLDVMEADRLLAQFADELHQDQKHAILFETVVELCRGQPRDTRFKFILRSLKDAADKVAGGYKLFIMGETVVAVPVHPSCCSLARHWWGRLRSGRSNAKFQPQDRDSEGRKGGRLATDGRRYAGAALACR